MAIEFREVSNTRSEFPSPVSEGQTFDGTGMPDDGYDSGHVHRISFARAALIAAASCLFIGLLESVSDLALSAIGGRERTVAVAIRAQLPWWVLWMAFMPAVLALARRYRFEGEGGGRSLLKSAAAHTLMGLTIALSHGVAYGLSYQFVSGAPLRAELGNPVLFFLSRYLFMDVMTYCAAISIYWSVEYFAHFRHSALAAARAEARVARLQLRLADARIQALRMELNPHFLFNALNSVAGLVRKGEHGGAVEMLARVGEVLRTTLNRDMPTEVTLSEEVTLLRRFLDIELVRFGDRLRVVWEIDASTWDALVPPLVLQPLVENALRHGISRRSGAGLLNISAQRSGLQLELAVRDSGEGIGAPGGRPIKAGIGLANTRARLEELYGRDASRVDLENAPGGGARVRVLLPFHVSQSRLHATASA